MVALPFADLILLSNACSISVIWSTILAIIFLDEKFMWKYDMVAITLICTGSMLTVIQSNKEEVTITEEVALDFIYSPRTVLYLLSVSTFIGVSLFLFKRFLAEL